jgi:hypothetical protein
MPTFIPYCAPSHWDRDEILDEQRQSELDLCRAIAAECVPLSSYWRTPKPPMSERRSNLRNDREVLRKALKRTAT